MTFLYTKESRAKARRLRRTQTDAEKHLWQKLRSGRTGYKFYRQYLVGNYITDFYCPTRKLVIELDGSHHLKKKQYDGARTDFLKSKGIYVIRFWDNDVMNNITGVLEVIYRRINETR